MRGHDGGREITYPTVLASSGKPLQLEDVEVVAGSGAVPFNRKRFGAAAAKTAASPRKRKRRS